LYGVSLENFEVNSLKWVLSMEKLKAKVVELAAKVYGEIGPFGFLKEVDYERALAYEFRKSNLKYLEQLQVNIMYEDQILRGGTVDFVVFDEKEEVGLIVELKTQEEITGEYLHQLLKYFEAIKSQESGIPKFLAEKIKGGIVLNWKVNKYIKNTLLEEFDKKKEEREVELLFEKFKKLKDSVDIIEIKINKEKLRKKNLERKE
jgi:GxxExxY protein